MKRRGGPSHNDVKNVVEVADFFHGLAGKGEKVVVVEIITNDPSMVSREMLKHRKIVKNEGRSFEFVPNVLWQALNEWSAKDELVRDGPAKVHHSADRR